MSLYENYIKCIESLKQAGVPKSDALSCLEFDSDEYPDMKDLNKALDEVYGKLN
jgi:hypothetical protein